MASRVKPGKLAAAAASALAVAALAACSSGSTSTVRTASATTTASSASRPAPAVHGCATVTSQLVTYADRIKASQDTIADLAINAGMITDQHKDVADPATPNSLAQPEIQFADALQNFSSSGVTAAVAKIHKVCN